MMAYVADTYTRHSAWVVLGAQRDVTMAPIPTLYSLLRAKYWHPWLEIDNVISNGDYGLSGLSFGLVQRIRPIPRPLSSRLGLPVCKCPRVW